MKLLKEGYDPFEDNTMLHNTKKDHAGPENKSAPKVSTQTNGTIASQAKKVTEMLGGFYQLKANPNHVQILEKLSILVGNIFLLSNQKAALDPFRFNVLLKKFGE